MLPNISKKLFPKSSRWQRRRKMNKLIAGVVGIILIVAATAVIIAAVSGGWQGLSVLAPRGSTPLGEVTGRQ
jgi:hypothetical protein